MTSDERPLKPIFDSIGNVLDASVERADKKNYAEKLSRELALLFASRLRTRFSTARVTPHSDGRGQEFRIGGNLDAKKTDVAVWDDRAGLVLGVSIKTITARDSKTQRYTKNVLRNDMELRDEADKLHRRQPWAVLTAVIFLPEDSTWDGRAEATQSSFAHAVFSFRKRAGRDAAHAARFDTFEQVYLGLFDREGRVGFFDVDNAPPRNQIPGRLLTLTQLLDRMEEGVKARHLVGGNDRFAEDDPNWSPPASLVESALGAVLSRSAEEHDEATGLRGM
jgi:hypothetical protein